MTKDGRYIVNNEIIKKGTIMFDLKKLDEIQSLLENKDEELYNVLSRKCVSKNLQGGFLQKTEIKICAPGSILFLDFKKELFEEIINLSIQHSIKIKIKICADCISLIIKDLIDPESFSSLFLSPVIDIVYNFSKRKSSAFNLKDLSLEIKLYGRKITYPINRSLFSYFELNHNVLSSSNSLNLRIETDRGNKKNFVFEGKAYRNYICRYIDESKVDFKSSLDFKVLNEDYDGSKEKEDLIDEFKIMYKLCIFLSYFLWKVNAFYVPYD